ncbi:hypothetical protein [Streptomyces sp. NBC_01518]|uniref:hypothetical protein n=1 Tax=Streptomyces sp. NBC_01518 TaxID=2903891 RepID=UPI00386A7B9A
MSTARLSDHQDQQQQSLAQEDAPPAGTDTALDEQIGRYTAAAACSDSRSLAVSW